MFMVAVDIETKAIRSGAQYSTTTPPCFPSPILMEQQCVVSYVISCSFCTSLTKVWAYSSHQYKAVLFRGFTLNVKAFESCLEKNGSLPMRKQRC